MSCQKPCAQCPWRLKNQGKKSPGGFYTKENLTRLWGQLRRGEGEQSCHLTDPSHPDHIAAGAKPGATPHECVGSVIVVLRELHAQCDATKETPTLTPESLAAYQKRRGRKGMTKPGTLYWGVARMTHGGRPFIGGPKLPKVNVDDPEVGLPDYLREKAIPGADKGTPACESLASW